MQQRIGAVIRAYEEQGFHRTATTVDLTSADWLADEVRRTAIQSFKNPGYVGGQIVHGDAVKRAAALSSTAHVDRDGLQPSGRKHARQLVKITGAAAGIREQHDRNARAVKGAFERRAADFDVSMLLHSHSPRAA